MSLKPGFGDTKWLLKWGILFGGWTSTFLFCSLAKSEMRGRNQTWYIESQSIKFKTMVVILSSQQTWH